VSPRRAATRASALARWQAEHVVGLLAAARPDLDVEIALVDTLGDRRQDVPIAAMQGQGVFVKEVQAAVLDGRADLAVHSAKDLTSTPTPGLVLAAVPRRADPRDALVGARLRDLAAGATVATGSVRRRAQLAALRPDLAFVELRGNIATRLAKVPAGGAIVMAVAALERLGQADQISEAFDVDTLVPQVAQGALAVECREDDDELRAALALLEDPPSRFVVDVERAFLAELGGGCDVPVGCHAELRPGGLLALRVFAAPRPGEVLRRAEVVAADDALDAAREVARDVLAVSG
jgi:hydroxymethylbilane synthase